MLSEEIQLNNMQQHSELEAWFQGQDVLLAEITLEDLIGELANIGKCSFQVSTQGPIIEWTCQFESESLSSEIITTKGTTLLLATLRCLMEVAYLVKKQIRNELE
jgi:hypothetical protein